MTNPIDNPANGLLDELAAGRRERAGELAELVYGNLKRYAAAVIGHDGAQGRDRVRAAAQGTIEELSITVPLSDSKSIHTIENRPQVLSRDYGTDAVTLRTRISSRQLDQLRSAGARMAVQK